ncbi:MAG: DUF1152 domain-containing protein [Aeropyrum sp.]|nr:DUF1152 domain-containing protein [Aeropyrum sp.]
MAIGTLEDLKDKKVLVFGAGGGGDALGTIHLYLKLKRIGAEPIAASVVWERLVVDPTPGPTPTRAIIGAQHLGDTIALVRGYEYAERGGRRYIPQVVRLAKVLGEESIALGLDLGSEGLVVALNTAKELLGVEAVIAVDSGGDAVAYGCEEELWSPLADAISLAGLLDSGVETKLLAIHGYGVDGELSRDYVVKRLSELAHEGGIIEIASITRGDLQFLSRVERVFVSEASKAPIWAFNGRYGEIWIRGGTRKIFLDILQSTTTIIDPTVLSRSSGLPNLARGSRSVYEASMVLNRRCIYTELDLEMDLNASPGESPIDVRRAGKKRLLDGGCAPLC